MRAAERRVAQATAKIGAAEAALYPDVSLTGSLSTAASRPGDLLRASSVSWSWGPSVSVPIFDGGKLAAERDATQAQRDEYLVAWRSSVLTAMEDVENALVSLSQERLRAKQLGAAVDNYRKAADLSRTQYEAGKSSFLDVLDAERSLYSAEDSLIQSRSLARQGLCRSGQGARRRMGCAGRRQPPRSRGREHGAALKIPDLRRREIGGDETPSARRRLCALGKSISDP